MISVKHTIPVLCAMLGVYFAFQSFLPLSLAFSFAAVLLVLLGVVERSRE